MARKVKISESVEHNNDVNVRLAAQQLMRAIKAAKEGDIPEMATFIRLAAMFEQDIPTQIRFPEMHRHG